MYFNIKVLFYVLIFNLDVQVILSLRSCCPRSDCIPVTQCLASSALAKKKDQASIALLRSVFCGFVEEDPYICCSKLPQPPPSTESREELDTHPNLSLLPQNCGFINKKRIVGGSEADLYEFPWMVLISYETRDGRHFKCGGTLINNRYVLTAAHCIKGEKIAGVRVGEHDLRTDTDCVGEPPSTTCEKNLQDIRVEEATYHPQFGGRPGVIAYDIGLLRLKKPVDFSFKNAGAICLPVTSTLQERNVERANATIAGWGHTETGYSSPVLLNVNVPIYTADACREQAIRRNPATADVTNKICAGEPGKDSCGGDSGGPLMVPGFHNNVMRYIQYGIVSYGPKECGSEFPGIYTDVSKYMKWILDNIRN